MADRIGQQIGNYRLERLLGSGGFAEVYLGQHIHIHTSAAIKFLKMHLSSQRHQEGFLREAEIVARFRHQHIIRLLDFGINTEDNNTPYLIMEYAPNGTLRDRHPKGSIIPLSTVAEYVKQIAKALQYAHDQKLIHRDLKPENVLVGNDGEILLSDFGVAATVHGTQSVKTGKLYAGTPVYSAPEQLRGNPSPASDQYSLDVMVYEWLSGHLPIFGSTPMELAMKHVEEVPHPLAERMPGIPPAVSNVVMRALAKNPEQRFDSVREFATRFEIASSQEASAMKSMLCFPSTNPPIAPANQPGLQPPLETASYQATSVVKPMPLLPSIIPPIAPADQPGQQPPKRRRRWLWIALGVVGVLLLVCVGGGFLLFNFLTYNGATDVANQYYTAVENQDYNTTYTYLDTSNLTLNGQPLTQSLYIQGAMLIDQTKGKLTAYSITNTSLNSNNGVNTAMLTVSETRNGAPYDVHVQLKQESRGWKITSLDNF